MLTNDGKPPTRSPRRQSADPISPWCVVIRVRDGLIIESRSYLSDEELLDQLGLIGPGQSPNAPSAED